MKEKDSVVTEFHTTGPCVVDVDKVVKKWNRLWWISQWDTEYRLIKYLRKDSPNTTLKVTISTEQAMEIIKKVGLSPLPGGFRSATSWKKVD